VSRVAMFVSGLTGMPEVLPRLERQLHS